MITTALIVRVPAPVASGYQKLYILTFVRGSGSVRVHLSTILRVQVWFRFTEVKFCWFRFGSGSPKSNGSFGFTVRVQVRFDTLILATQKGGHGTMPPLNTPLLIGTQKLGCCQKSMLLLVCCQKKNEVIKFRPKNVII